MAIIWTPKAAGSNAWDSSHLSAGDVNSGLNQIVNQLNTIGAPLSLPNLPFFTANSSRVNKASIKPLVDNANSINAALGTSIQPTILVPARLGPTLIKQLRDSLTDGVFQNSNARFNRFYTNQPMGTYTDINAYTDTNDSSNALGVMALGSSSTFINRQVIDFYCTGNAHIQASVIGGWFASQDTGSDALGIVKVPYQFTMTVYRFSGYISDQAGLTFNSVENGTPIASGVALDATNGTVIDLGTFSPGKYTLCFAIDSDIFYCSQSVNNPTLGYASGYEAQISNGGNAAVTLQSI
jgi:hypothetical protein